MSESLADKAMAMARAVNRLYVNAGITTAQYDMLNPQRFNGDGYYEYMQNAFLFDLVNTVNNRHAPFVMFAHSRAIVPNPDASTLGTLEIIEDHVTTEYQLNIKHTLGSASSNFADPSLRFGWWYKQLGQYTGYRPLDSSILIPFNDPDSTYSAATGILNEDGGTGPSPYIWSQIYGFSDGLVYSPSISKDTFFDGDDNPSIAHCRIDYIGFLDIENLPPEPTPGGGMELKLWRNFSKRKNSTKRPTGGLTYSVLLKRDTSILNPHFVMDFDIMYFDYNYCKFNDRYYYIDDVISLNNSQIEIVCSIDYLATWKDSILASRAYIERSSDSSQVLMGDDSNPPTMITETEQTLNLIDMGGDNQNFIMTLACAEGIRVFAMDNQNLTTLFSWIWGTSHTQEEINIFQGMIASLIQVPYAIPNDFIIGGGPGHLTINGVDTGATVTESQWRVPFMTSGTATVLKFPSRNFITMTDVSDYITGENYVDYEPYSTGELYLPYVGVVQLDLSVWAHYRTIQITAYTDIPTGDIVYELTAIGLHTADPTDPGDTDAKTIATYSGNCAKSVPITGKSWNAKDYKVASWTTIGGGLLTVAGIASIFLPGIGAGVSTALISTGVGTAASGASRMYKSKEIHSQVSGSISSALGYSLGYKAYATIFTHHPANTVIFGNRDITGMPVNKVDDLSSHTGFIKTAGIQVEMAGSKTEKEAVNQLVNSGIYIE